MNKPIIDNVNIYGIHDSFKGSKYPMSVDVNSVNSDFTNTIRKLGSAKMGSGHDNFLNGIIVQFDLCFTIKAWAEAERYHFLDFVSSQSTIHCISKFDIEPQCNEYVTKQTIEEVNRLKEIYLRTNDPEDYLRLLYNVPTGFRLTARMTTNYRQLKTIYYQRKSHRLKEWKTVCAWIETLPYMSAFLTKEGENNE